MTPAALFDRLAATYDAQWTATAIGRAQRKQVWNAIDPLFRAGDRILDIGCGTGEDAAHLESRGVRVYAIDASPAMVRIARSKGITATVRTAENLVPAGPTFDGAISNFGALNCVEHLFLVAGSLAGVVRPGGRVAICLLGRVCAWETLHYALRFQFAKAARRWAGQASASDITIHYPTVAEFRAAFSPHFELQRWTAIGLFVPPSYVPLPGACIRALTACDRLFSRVPLLRSLSDHRLFVLVRKPC